MLGVLTLAELAGSLETTLVFAALPTAMRQFGDPIAVGWLITGYFLVAGASAALCGRLGDLFGRTRVLIVVLAVAAIGSAISAFHDDLTWILIGRSVQGLAGAVLPLCYGLAREQLPPERVSLGVGVITAAASLGAAGGFIIGGVIVDNSHWQHVFTFSAVLALAALVFSWRFLPQSTPRAEQRRQLDIFGGILFAPSIAALMGAISRLQGSGVDTVFAVLLVGGGVGLALWVRHELRHPNPLIDVRLLANPQVALANGAALLVSMGAYQVMQIFPILLQQPVWTGIGFGLTATMTGLLKLPSNVTSAIGASWAGGVCDRFGGRAVVMTGAAMCIVGWLGLLLGSGNLWLVVLFICSSSAGAVIVVTGVVSVILSVVPPDRTSEATGMTVVFRMTFQALGAQIVAILIATSIVAPIEPGGHSYPSPEAIRWAIAYVLAMNVLAFLAGFFLRRPKPRRPALA